MMPLSRDLMGIGEDAEEALRVGDVGPRMLTTIGTNSQSVGTLVGGPTGATILEINPSTLGNNAITFLATTEIDREFTIYNVGTVASTSVASSNLLNVYPPLGSSFNGLSNNAAFTIGINKSATVTRLGAIPPVSQGSVGTFSVGGVAADRWIYVVSA